MTTPLPNIVLGTVLAAQLAASNAFAACIVTSEVAARGRFVRCEDAKFYLEASGAYERYERALEEILARTEPGRRDAVREQLGIDPDATSLLRAGYEARVAVVLVEWRASIAPWRPDSSDAVELVAEPQELYETARYWWNGSIESCESIVGGAAIDLWVHPPCCDSGPASPICMVSMSYAEPAPDEMSRALSEVLGDR